MPDVEVIVREDGGSWSAWSPQCPGLLVVQPSPEDLREALRPALQFYFADDQEATTALRYVVNLEQEINGVVVRVRQDEDAYQRQLLAQRVAAKLGGLDTAEDMRSSPVNPLGDVVFICALPSDTFGWISRQMEDEDTINVVLPASEIFVWSVSFSSTQPPASAAGPRGSDLGYQESTTLGEIMTRDASSAAGRLILV